MPAGRIVGAGLAAATTAVLVAIAVMADLPASAYRGGDFFGFWAASRAIVEGASPYDPVWFADIARRSGAVLSFGRSVYPPWTALILLPFALLPFGVAATAWLAVQLGVVAASTLLLARRIGRIDRPVFIAVVAASQPLWLLVAGGNLVGLLAGAAAGSVLAAAAGRPFLAGAFFGLLAIKPHPFLLVVVAALLAANDDGRRRFVAGALASAAPLIGVALALHPSWFGDWLGAAGGLQGSTGSNATLWTVGRIADPGIPAAVGPFLGAAAVLIALLAWTLWYRAARPPAWLAMAVALPVSLSIAPHGWSYDQLVLVVPLAIVFGALGERSARARRRGVVIAALVATAVPWVLYASAFRRGGEELSVLTPLLLFVALWYLRPTRFRLDTDPTLPAPILR